MQHLNIDIETFSSAPIAKTGLYRYAQSPDFAILLLGYSLDGGPVRVVDLAAGERLPREVLRLMMDPSCVKHAWNAAFEWYCLSRHFRLTDQSRDQWAAQWQDTMLHLSLIHIYVAVKDLYALQTLF